MRAFRNAVCGLAALVLVLGPAWRGSPTARADAELATEAQEILRNRCHRCHGLEFRVEGLDVLDHDTLTRDRGADRPAYIVPGNAGESKLWLYVEDDTMPPGDDKLSSAEKATLQKWIDAGAEFPPEAASREHISQLAVLTAIQQRLNSLNAADRPFQRFFVLTHVWNNGSVTDRELRLHRAALAKAINSLSQQPAIVHPDPCDLNETVYAVDLRAVGWSPRQWHAAMAGYPYGLSPTKFESVQKAEDIRAALADATQLVYVRADWFIAHATRSPRYEQLLGLPKTVAELETQLNVDVEKNFRQDRILRAGFSESGVSGQSRVVERHDANSGAYWKTFDFRVSDGRGNPFRFPLGPKFNGNSFDRFAFEHAGGEMIFSLPNGLHGYMLANAEGGFIAEGPVDIVWDSTHASGSPVIVNGLSCMSCHRHGIQPFQDAVRQGAAFLDPTAVAKVGQLYAAPEKMAQAVKKDTDDYLRALKETIGRYVQQGDDADRDVREFPEPNTVVARRFLKDLSAQDVAAELWFEDVEAFRLRIRTDQALKALGLGPLANADRASRLRKIDRGAWEASNTKKETTFHQAARAVDLGLPILVTEPVAADRTAQGATLP